MNTLTEREAFLSQDEVRKAYNRLAPIYEVWSVLTESRARQRVWDLSAVRDGESVLEVAVGTGATLEKFAAANPSGRTCGIDLSEGMLVKSKDRLEKSGLAKRVELRSGSAFKLPYAAESFNLVVNQYMLDLIPFSDIQKILSEFHRVLKPGGRLVIAGMTVEEHFGSGIWQRLYDLSPSLMAGCRGIQMAPRLSASGFAVTSREYFQQLFFPSEVVAALKS